MGILVPNFSDVKYKNYKINKSKFSDQKQNWIHDSINISTVTLIGPWIQLFIYFSILYSVSFII